MRGRLVKWVDKTSFDRLNKLYLIYARERNHETPLTEENLLKLVRDPESYAVPSSLPRFAPRVLVHGEHYVVKDFSFYEEARAVDTKKMIDRFAKKKKKCQEETLKQALDGSHPTTNSTARPPPKKKSAPWPAEKALDLPPLPSSPSSPSTSAKIGAYQGSSGLPSVGV